MYIRVFIVFVLCSAAYYFYFRKQEDIPNVPYVKLFPDLYFEKWVIITSINYPTDAVNRLAEFPDWHVLVVGDKKSPKDWKQRNCTFLDVATQKSLPYEIVNLLPFGHYARKNVGYLFAIEHGAKVIYETDDDNLLRDGWDLERGFHSNPEATNFLSYKPTKNGIVNPYRYWGQETTWPRGFPLQAIHSSLTHDSSYGVASRLKIGIQQGLANGDPDMDAIFRLTRKDHNKPIEFNFDETLRPIALPHFMMSPFNSQNTLFHYTAFWGLLIPITTTFRVCDIWRGYWAQRLLWEIDEHLAFFPPSVLQKRNPHDYLADYIDEIPLYEDAGRLVEFLLKWRCTERTFFKCISQLTNAMVQKNFWFEKENLLVNAWLRDLKRVGYQEPSLLPSSQSILTSVNVYSSSLPTSNLGDSLPNLDSKFLRCETSS